MKLIKHEVKTYISGSCIRTQTFSTKQEATEEVSALSEYYEKKYTGEIEIKLYCEYCDKDLTLDDEYIKTDEYTRYCSDCYEENSFTYYTVGGDQVGDENDTEEYDGVDQEGEAIQ